MADLPNALRTFHEAIKDCQKCALAAGRTQVVFGGGNPEADIMVVTHMLAPYAVRMDEGYETRQAAEMICFFQAVTLC